MIRKSNGARAWAGMVLFVIVMPFSAAAARAEESIARQWNEVLLEAIRMSRLVRNVPW